MKKEMRDGVETLMKSISVGFTGHVGMILPDTTECPTCKGKNARMFWISKFHPVQYNCNVCGAVFVKVGFSGNEWRRLTEEEMKECVDV